MMRTSVRVGFVVAVALVLPAIAAPAVAMNLTAGLLNLVPTVVSVGLSSLSVNPVAGSTSPLTVTVVASDGNGFNDITSVTIEVLKPDGSSHLAASAATFSGGSAWNATYVKTIQMNYYDPAAKLLDTYKIKVVVTDSQAASVDNLAALVGFNYGELAALSPAASSVSLGASILPGQAGSVQSLSIQNAGNVQIDAQVAGAALSHSSLAATIPVSAIRYSLSSDMSSAATLASSGATLSAFDLAPGAGSARSLYLQMTAPSALSQYLPAGTYTSTLTLTAVAG